VEDESIVRDLGVEILKQSGYRVVSAGTGEEALGKLAGVDLLFTDLVMPGMSGRELAMRALQVRPDLKVLYTTGYTDDDAVLRGVKTSELDLLQKPYLPAVLLGKVREVLDRAVRRS
jgi:CheY-like chemotaxis protein